jgi:hypothetical protein
MPFQHNLKIGIDLPVYQWLRFLPASSASGCCMCNDERGTNRFIYFIFSATSFWRYDTWSDSWQQLANPPSFTFGAGTAMVFDPSQGTQGRVWLFGPSSSSPYSVFAYYDVATNTWTTRTTPPGISSQWGTDARLVHTCSYYNSLGNDDYIYLIGNNSTTFYKYSISGNSWNAVAGYLPAGAGAGCALLWDWGSGGDPDKIYALRGAGTSTIYRYSITYDSWTTISYVPATETFTTGTSAVYDPVRRRIWIQKDATHRMYYLDLANLTLYPGGTWPYTSGTAIVGNGLCYIKTTDGAEYLYYRRQTGTEFWRTLIFF